MNQLDTTYAGLWRRLQAWIVDLILMMLTACAIAIVASPFIYIGATIYTRDQHLLNLIYKYSGASIGIITYFAYFIGFEISKFQATPGKLLFNLKITDMEGKPIGFGRSAFRLISKFLSGFLLGLGFVICDFTQQKQALHDIIANTLVIRSESEQSPEKAP